MLKFVSNIVYYVLNFHEYCKYFLQEKKNVTDLQLLIFVFKLLLVSKKLINFRQQTYLAVF